jgi:diguanylate cyclase (GGDEF)-like protein
MLKSKFVDKAKIEKSSKFLQMVFKSTKEPTIIIDSDTLKIIDCSESTIEKFELGDYNSIIGKTVRDINSLYLNDIIVEKKILKMESLANENIEFDLIINNEKRFFKIKPTKFKVDKKSYIIFTILDITEERNNNSKIYNMAFIDELTKIDNRRSGISKVEKCIIDSETSNLMFAVCFVDIDRFKQINDNYGHECGDIILKMIANILTVSTGVNDIVSRIGGDEFMIIVKDIPNINIIDTIAQRLVKKVDIPIVFEEQKISVTISVGISLFPNHGLNYKELMKNADIALYQAKKNGRNQYCIFDELV